MPTLSSKGAILGVTTKTPTDKKVQTFPCVTCSLAHEWDTKSLHTMEEDISRNVGAFMIEGGSPDLTNTGSDSD